MGLDIYLYDKAQAKANDAYNVAAEELYGRPDFDSLSKDERDALRDALPVYAGHTGVPSEKYPKHLFNRRYLRSSYNESGFNHAVPDFLATSNLMSYPYARGSLYWIFDPMLRKWEDDEGELTSNDLSKLHQCRARAVEVAEDLRKCDPLRVTTVSPNIFQGPRLHEGADALRIYRKKVAAGQVQEHGWSNAEMECFGVSGLTILAAIPGKGTFGEPAVHLIFRAEGEGFVSYIESAEIVVEFCDEAVSLIQRDGSCRLSWSG